jgi:hypothetical protein
MFEKLRALLIEEGWKEQNCGVVYMNGEYGTNFYKESGEGVIRVSYNAWPDEEEIENLRGDE